LPFLKALKYVAVAGRSLEDLLQGFFGAGTIETSTTIVDPSEENGREDGISTHIRR
jgi:hypothetical protein